MPYDLDGDPEDLKQILKGFPDPETICGESPDVIPKDHRARIYARRWKDPIEEDIGYEVLKEEFKSSQQ